MGERGLEEKRPDCSGAAGHGLRCGGAIRVGRGNRERKASENSAAILAAGRPTVLSR